MDDTQEASTETPELPPHPSQEDLLRESFARVLDDLPTLPGASGVRVGASRVRIAALSELSGTDVCGGGELVAGVLVRHAGRFDQVGLFAMEPEEAYELVQDGLGSVDPLGAFSALGRELVGAAALAIDPHGVTQEGDATLQEDSVIGMLLRTHAASDAVVVSLELTLCWAESEASRLAHVYVLADSKPFAAALAAA
jgi:hypothetical protein